jgi:hypothetical protein
LRRGSRLSVTPVTAAEFRTIEKLGQAKPAAPAAKSAPAKPAKKRAR